MKLLLCTPPSNIKSTFPPIGLLYLQSSLKQNNYETLFFEGSNKSYNDLEDYIKKIAPDFIGLSCWTIGINNIYTFMKYIKEKFNTKILTGGQHASFCPKQVLNNGADYVFSGESELKLPQFLKNYNDDNYIKKIGSVSFKTKNNNLHIDNNFELIADLDLLPFPCYDDINNDNYCGIKESKNGNSIAGVISSRGCPYACNFCSSSFYWKRKTNFRSPDNIITEIKYLIQEKLYKEIIFYDDNFFLNKNRVIELCKKIIGDKIIFKWIALGRVNNIDEEIVYYAKQAGCYRIDFGIESGCQKILNNIGKNISIEQIINTAVLLKKSNIIFHPYLITGSPGEDINSVEETVKLLKKIDADAKYYGSNIMWILPGTPIFEDLKDKKNISEDIWLNKEQVFYTKEHSYEKLQLFENFISFNVTGGFAYEYELLKSYIIEPLNNYFKNKKVLVYGKGEISEIIFFNKNEIIFELVSEKENPDYVFVSSVSHGKIIKDRLLKNNFKNLNTLQDIYSKLKFKFDIPVLNSKIIIYKRMKNKILFDLKYFEKSQTKLLLSNNNYISDIIKLLIKNNKINIEYEIDSSDKNIIISNEVKEDYEWNDYYYPLNRRRL